MLFKQITRITKRSLLHELAVMVEDEGRKD